MAAGERYGIDVLADLGGVSRRTVRFYVQEGLIPPPFGLGRGDHYGPEHLQALLRVKALQQAGRSLDEIKRSPASGRSARSAAVPATPPPAETWRRIRLAPGVELHIHADRHLPSAAALETIIEWCRTELRHRSEDRNAND